MANFEISVERRGSDYADIVVRPPILGSQETRALESSVGGIIYDAGFSTNVELHNNHLGFSDKFLLGRAQDAAAALQELGHNAAVIFSEAITRE